MWVSMKKCMKYALLLAFGHSEVGEIAFMIPGVIFMLLLRILNEIDMHIAITCNPITSANVLHNNWCRSISLIMHNEHICVSSFIHIADCWEHFCSQKWVGVVYDSLDMPRSLKTAILYCNICSVGWMLVLIDYTMKRIPKKIQRSYRI